jgi:hypothetical protein
MIVPDLGNLPCFACASDKRPLVKAWPLAAERIEPKPYWPLVGVPTGVASGFDVIDIDPEGLPWLEANRHLLQTRAHKTQRGWHFLVQAGDLSGSNDDRIAPGVDVRANGNFAIWWPRQCKQVIDLPIAPWPAELLEKAKAKVRLVSAHRLETPRLEQCSPRVVVSRNSREGRYASAALRNAFVKLANWPQIRVEGKWQRQSGRNTMLNKLAFKMGGLVANGWIDEALVVRVLMLAAADCGLVRDDGEAQCLATIHSGLQAGMQLPYPQLGPRYG